MNESSCSFLFFLSSSPVFWEISTRLEVDTGGQSNETSSYIGSQNCRQNIRFAFGKYPSVQWGTSDWSTEVRLSRRAGNFLLSIPSRSALAPTQPPIQWVSEALSRGVMRPGREAGHSHSSGAEVKNAWSYTSTLSYVFMAWCLVKHRDNFTFNHFKSVRTQAGLE